jgi:hypothetical protein
VRSGALTIQEGARLPRGRSLGSSIRWAVRVMWQQAYATWHTSILSGLGKDTPYGGCVKYRLLASVMAVADP